MDKFWCKSYPQGVSTHIDCEQYGSLVELLEESFQQHATRPAYVCMNRFMTYGELDRLSQQLGAWLQQTGLAQGARIGLMMPNVLQYPVVFAAALRAGFVVVNINPLYTPRELAHQLCDAGVEAIFILDQFVETLAQVIATTPVQHIVVTSIGEMSGAINSAAVNFLRSYIQKTGSGFSLPTAVWFNQALTVGAGLTLRPVARGPDDVAFLQYTGGTTGVSKGAMLLHRNVVANVLQNVAWVQPALRDVDVTDQLVIVCALPLYHIFALTACSLMGMRLGAMNILIPNPRDIAGLVRELAKYKVSMLPGVNTLYNSLLNHPDFAKLDFSSLKICNGGGMAVQQVVSERWHSITGCHIIEGYGLSETAPTVTCNPADATSFSGTIGLPLPSTELAILDENGLSLPPGQPGEIAIRGPQVMAGYWNRPDETAQVMTAEGYFKTGDVGVMDELGYTRIVDRKKDMILVSGFNVYPTEVEGVVAAHPDVLECACIGVPDASSGEAVKLFVVRKRVTLTVEQLMAFCKEQFTGYKKPKYIEFLDELPKSNVGKILRRELRQQHSKG